MNEVFFSANHSKQFLHSSLRVNHAGERAAKNIYSAQIKFTKDRKTKRMFEHMLSQELVHLEFFEKEMKRLGVRPSLLLPIWDLLSYSLGAGTALLGKEASMMCTEAVEDVIDKHYASQIPFIEDESLKSKIECFRQEELSHKNIAIQNDSALAPGYSILYKIIKYGCEAAIKLSKKI